MTWSPEKFMVMKRCVSRRRHSPTTSTAAATMSTPSTTVICSMSRASDSYSSRRTPTSRWESHWRWPRMDAVLLRASCTVEWFIVRRRCTLAMRYGRSTDSRWPIRPLVNYRGFWWVFEMNAKQQREMLCGACVVLRQEKLIILNMIFSATLVDP